MKPITPVDVARFLNGEVTDKQQWLWIAEAIETDPQVRQWYDQLDLESLLPSEDALAEDDVAADASTSGRVAQITRSQLCTLAMNSAPASLISDSESISGRVIGQFYGAEQQLDCTLRHVADNPPTFELVVPKWPDGYQPLGVLLGQFVHTQRQPAESKFQLQREVAIPDSEKVQRKPAAGDVDARTLADLIADSFSRAAVRGEPRGQSSDVTWGFDELQGNLLHVIADVPGELEGDMVVAELHYVDTERNQVLQRQGVWLDRRLDNGRCKGAVRFAPLDQLGEREVTITVRSMTDADLHLLPQPAVVPFLARQTFLSLPSESTPSGFRFRARWQDQQAVARDPGTCWCLQVAPIGKGE